MVPVDPFLYVGNSMLNELRRFEISVVPLKHGGKEDTSPWMMNTGRGERVWEWWSGFEADSAWPAPFDKDLVKFKKAYQVGSDDASIQNAIMLHGSFTAQMNVYSCSPHLRLWRRKW